MSYLTDDNDFVQMKRRLYDLDMGQARMLDYGGARKKLAPTKKRLANRYNKDELVREIRKKSKAKTPAELKLMKKDKLAGMLSKLMKGSGSKTKAKPKSRSKVVKRKVGSKRKVVKRRAAPKKSADKYNAWTCFVRVYGYLNGMKYNEAMKSPKVKSEYQKFKKSIDKPRGGYYDDESDYEEESDYDYDSDY